MNRLPTVTAREMMQFLHHLGFIKTRRHGSHVFFRHSDGRTATVPEHPAEDLGRGITNKILNDAEVSRDDFLKWYHKKK
jgi:predicted RNA binding protein YcfA (HicA-like mRNA interferase family)